MKAVCYLMVKFLKLTVLNFYKFMHGGGGGGGEGGVGRHLPMMHSFIFAYRI